MCKQKVRTTTYIYGLGLPNVIKYLINYRFMSKFDESNCLPIYMKTISEYGGLNKTLKYCNFTKDFGNYYFPLMKEFSACPRPCHSFNYRGITNSFNYWYKENDSKAYYEYQSDVIFPTNEVLIREEYLIYKSNDLIGIVGGTLGLFLGFSVYDYLIKFYNSMENFIKIHCFNSN